MEKSEIDGLNIKRYGDAEVLIPKGITALCIMCCRRRTEPNDAQCKECNEAERKWLAEKEKERK